MRDAPSSGDPERVPEESKTTPPDSPPKLQTSALMEVALVGEEKRTPGVQLAEQSLSHLVLEHSP